MHNGRQGPQPEQRLWSPRIGVPATLSGIPLHTLMLSSCSSRIGAFVVSLCLAAGCTGRHSMTRREVAPGEAVTPAVSWMAPEVSADRSSLHSWRRSVGPPVVVAADRAVLGPADRLVIVNWNMHVGGGDFHRLFLE